MNQVDRNQEATLYIGNLDEKVTDAIVWELFLQCGPVTNVHLPKDRVTASHSGFGFCEFLTQEDAEYAVKIMNQVKLYGKPIRVNKASADKRMTADIGAELFVGNLDAYVDEKALFETFSKFGQMTKPPSISRDENGQSKGFGFLSFDNFESSDQAVGAMNNQFLMNKPITVSYAFKKDGKGERHGDQAERMLAAAAKKNNVSLMPQTTLPPGFVPGQPLGMSGSLPAGFAQPPPQMMFQPPAQIGQQQ